MAKVAKQHERGGKRRVFRAEFKLEAVRRMRARRAAGVSLAQSSRELDIRPDMLRAWAKQADTHSGAAPGLGQHSDRGSQGSQYARGAHQPLLAAHGVTCSRSRKGDCWDNAVAESFFATLELELVAETNFPSRHAARRAIFEFIEVWYNRERRHSSLGYVSPAEYEAQLEQRQRVA